MSTNTRYDVQSYDEIKTELIAKISTYLPEWTDTRETDMGVVLIELFSYLGDILSFKINRAVQESFLVTAQLETSVYKSAKTFGYSFRGKLAASCTLVFTLSAVRGSDTVIPKGTRVGDELGEVVFEITVALTIPAGKLGNEITGSTYDYSVAAKNYVLKEDVILGSVTPREDLSKDFLEFNFPDSDVIRNSVTVYVHNGTSWIQWTVVDTLAFSAATDKEVLLELDESGDAKLIFGNDTMGMIPETGTDNVKVDYATGGGVDANDYNVGELTILLTSVSYVASVTNVTKPSGGEDEESIATIKETLPTRWSRLYRAVTDTDFTAIAIDYGIGKVAAVSAGNIITLYVLDSSGNALSTSAKAELAAYIEDRMLIGQVLRVSDAYKVSVNLQVNVVVLSGYTSTTVKTAVGTALTNQIFSISVRDLGELLALGDVYEVIENVSGVDYSTVSFLYRQPYARQNSNNTGDLVFTFTPTANMLAKVWTMVMTSSTAFYITDGINLIEGSIGGVTSTEHDLNGEVTMTVVAGTVSCVAGDTFYIRTSNYLGDIYAEDLELLVEGTVTVT